MLNKQELNRLNAVYNTILVKITDMHRDLTDLMNGAVLYCPIIVETEASNYIDCIFEAMDDFISYFEHEGIFQYRDTDSFNTKKDN